MTFSSLMYFRKFPASQHERLMILFLVCILIWPLFLSEQLLKGKVLLRIGPLLIGTPNVNSCRNVMKINYKPILA